jgi:phosphoenolpyruvate phosphomutase
MLEVKPFLRFIDVHSGISGLIIENTKIIRKNQLVEFDGMWSSSLVDSTSRGKPDNESVDLSTRIQSLQPILEVTSKPIIFDGDTGGKIEHFGSNVRNLERNGISAVIIEDKVGLKRNSLFGNEVVQNLDDPDAFSEKIREGIDSRVSKNFMIIARIESLIVDAGLPDALLRAKKYIEAGADGIMIHSRKKDPTEIYDFANEFEKWNTQKPLVLVPTTFNSVTEEELAARGARIIIHANHLLRASYPSMLRVASNILENGRTSDVEPDLMTIKEILNFIPGG